MRLELLRIYLNCPESVLLVNFIHESGKEEKTLTGYILANGTPNYKVDNMDVQRGQFMKDSDTNSIQLYLSLERLNSTLKYLDIRGIQLSDNRCYFRDKITYIQYKGDKKSIRGMYDCVIGSIIGLDGVALDSFIPLLDELSMFGYKGFNSSSAKFAISELHLKEEIYVNSPINTWCYINFNTPSTQVRQEIFDIYEKVYEEIPTSFTLISISRLKLKCNLDKLGEFFSKLREKYLVDTCYSEFISDSLFVQYIDSDKYLFDGIYKSDIGKLIDFPNKHRLCILTKIRELETAVTGREPMCLDITDM